MSRDREKYIILRFREIEKKKDFFPAELKKESYIAIYKLGYVIIFLDQSTFSAIFYFITITKQKQTFLLGN